MARFVELATIWTEVLSYNRRRTLQEEGRYNSEYDDFRQRIAQRLHLWSSKLPAELHCSGSNIAARAQQGKLVTLVNLQSLQFAITMRLNRYFFYDRVPTWTSSQKIDKAREAAVQTLQLMGLSLQHDPARNNPTIVPLAQLILHPGIMPCARYALTLAVDILSAGGSTEQKHLHERLSSLDAIIPLTKEPLPCHWHSSTKSNSTLCGRIDALFRMETSGSARDYKAWRFRKPLDSTSTPDLDIFYVRSRDRPDSPGLYISDATLFDRLSVRVSPQEVLILD